MVTTKTWAEEQAAEIRRLDELLAAQRATRPARRRSPARARAGVRDIPAPPAADAPTRAGVMACPNAQAKIAEQQRHITELETRLKREIEWVKARIPPAHWEEITSHGITPDQAISADIHNALRFYAEPLENEDTDAYIARTSKYGPYNESLSLYKGLMTTATDIHPEIARIKQYAEDICVLEAAPHLLTPPTAAQIGVAQEQYREGLEGWSRKVQRNEALLREHEQLRPHLRSAARIAKFEANDADMRSQLESMRPLPVQWAAELAEFKAGVRGTHNFHQIREHYGPPDLDTEEAAQAELAKYDLTPGWRLRSD